MVQRKLCNSRALETLKEEDIERERDAFSVAKPQTVGCTNYCIIANGGHAHSRLSEVDESVASSRRGAGFPWASRVFQIFNRTSPNFHNLSHCKTNCRQRTWLERKWWMVFADV